MGRYAFSLLMFGLLSGMFLSIDNGYTQQSKTFFKPGTIRVLLITGRENPAHDWQSLAAYLRQIMMDTERFDVRIIEEPAGITAETLEVYDLLVMYYCGPRLGETAERAITDFVKSGKGFVPVHSASYSFQGLNARTPYDRDAENVEPPWEEFRKMVGELGQKT